MEFAFQALVSYRNLVTSVNATPYDLATKDLDPPLAIIDLEAFDANSADLVRRAAGKPIRIVSKSVRCRFLLERVLARPGFKGLMCYSLAEALWHVEQGTTDDTVVPYPTAPPAAARGWLRRAGPRAPSRGVLPAPRRAPVFTPKQAAELARIVVARKGFR